MIRYYCLYNVQNILYELFFKNLLDICRDEDIKKCNNNNTKHNYINNIIIDNNYFKIFSLFYYYVSIFINIINNKWKI